MLSKGFARPVHLLPLVQPLFTVLIQVTPTKSLSRPSHRSCITFFCWASQQTSTYSNSRTIPLCPAAKAFLVKEGRRKAARFPTNIPRVLLRSCQLEGFSSSMITQQRTASFSFAPRSQTRFCCRQPGWWVSHVCDIKIHLRGYSVAYN